jgi:hypothetical protein
LGKAIKPIITKDLFMFNSIDRLIGSTLLLISTLAFIFFVATFPTQGHALELYNYKDGQTATTTMNKATLEKLWQSAQPTCLKDGAKLLGVNKAFKDNGLGYRDCSSSKARKKIHSALGFTVNVVKLHELPVSMIRELKGKK